MFEWRKSVHYRWSSILFSPEWKELASMLDPLLHRWGVPPVVIRCVHLTMQMWVLQTWIIAQGSAIIMDLLEAHYIYMPLIGHWMAVRRVIVSSLTIRLYLYLIRDNIWYCLLIIIIINWECGEFKERNGLLSFNSISKEICVWLHLFEGFWRIDFLKYGKRSVSKAFLEDMGEFDT